MNYWDASALCPFYKKESAQSRKIVCDGFTDDTRMHIVFTGSEKSRLKHLAELCCADYKSCPVFRVLTQKWED